MELKIREEYRDIVPKLKKTEYNALKMSLETEGQLYPVIVNKDGTILDGMHRFEILTGLGKETKFEIRNFPDKYSERKFVVEVNLKRRHLNEFQKGEMGMTLLKVETELAKQRMLAGKKTLPSQEGEVKRKGASSVIAKKIGISGATFERVKKIVEEGSDKVKELCRNEALGIRPAFGLVKAFETVPKEPKEALTEKLEDGKLDVKEIVKAIASTNAVKAQLQGEEDVVKEKAEELFKDQFYTQKLDSKSAIWEIEEIAGDPHHQVTKEFPLGEFASFDKAQEWAEARSGVCLGKIEKWSIKYDPLKDKKIKEAEKLESES